MKILQTHLLGNAINNKYLWLISSFFFLFAFVENNAQTNYTISKTHNVNGPIASGQPFTYTITYGWSGGAPGTLYITDTIPSTLDVISALPSGPISNISGNVVTFAIPNLNLPSGSGTVQINVRFKPGVTCEGETACNIAYITDDPERNEWLASHETCVVADTPENKWIFQKTLFAGCAIDDEVVFRISLINPSGSNIGGLNLTNVSLEDFLPQNAEIIDVIGSWNGPSNTTSNGVSWIPLTGGSTNFQVSQYTLMYNAYVKVKFPSGSFSQGQTVENIAKLDFQTACSNETYTWLDTAEVELCQGVTDATLHKSLNMGLYFPQNSYYSPNFTPGCCGNYRIWYKNTGTLSQTNVIMEDEVPGEIDVNAIYTQVQSGHEPVTLEIFTWNNGACATTPDTTITYSNNGFFTLNNLPSEICRIRWTYSGTIDVNDNIFNRFDACVRDTNFKTGNIVVPGQTIISNTANVTVPGLNPLSVTHDKLVDAASPKILATKLFIGECNDNCQVNPAGPYQPGDTVRFRIAVSNAGGLDATSASITDNLSQGLSYLGNETYFYGNFNWLANIYNPPCCSLTTNVPTEIGGNISTPSLGDTSLVWNFPVLPSRCDGGVDYFIIDFDVLIHDAPPALAGQHPNTFDFDATEISPVTSNTAYLTVNAVAQIQALKEVREQGSQSNWMQTDSIPQGSVAEYRITVNNTGNTPLTNLCLLDIMPHQGDMKVLPNYTPRGSTFDLPFIPNTGSISITPTGYSPEYSSVGLAMSQNPSRTAVCSGFCGITDPQGAINGNFTPTPTSTYSYTISANQGVNLAPGASLEALVTAQVPASTNIGEIGCNSFAVQAVPDAMPNVCLSAESNDACIEVTERVQDMPCFRFGELTLDCIEENDEGNWVYDFTIDITNVSGQNGWIQINPNNGNLYNINPNTLPNNTPTTVTGTFEVGQAPGSVCFDIIMYEDGSDTPLCDSTICIEYDICENMGCDCPYEIKIDKVTAKPGYGNNVSLYSLFNMNANIRNIRATVVSAVINETCFFGGNTTYNPPTYISSASNWGTIPGNITNQNSMEWTNEECPPLTNFYPLLSIHVPDLPGFFCYQNIEICVRYEFTDCECNDCDTTVCYNLRRKRIPIIVWGDHKPRGILGGITDNSDYNKDYGKEQSLQSEEEGYAKIEMSSYTEGQLQISLPEEDEYTYGITIHSIHIETSEGVVIDDIQSETGNWTQPEKTETGLLIKGSIKPGENENFDLTYVNPSSISKWTNTVQLGYSIGSEKDTIYGGLDIVSRTPDAMGGDKIENTDPGNNVENARTFALKFTNANKTQDSISRITLKVSEGSILAVGPGLESNQFELAGMETMTGTVTLLAAQPEKHIAMEKDILPGSAIGPVYLTVASDNEESIMLEYTTYSTHNEIVTKNEIELTNPVLGVEGSEAGMINVLNSYVYPNPAAHEVNFSFNLKSNENVTFTVRDLSGKTISVLIDNKLMLNGEHSVTLNTSAIPSGTYYYTIETGKESHTQKFVIVK